VTLLNKTGRDCPSISSQLLPLPPGVLGVHENKVIPHHGQWCRGKVPQCMSVDHTTPWRKVEQFEHSRCGCQRDYECRRASVCRTIGRRHVGKADKRRAAGQRKHEPKSVMCESNHEVEYDIVGVVESRCETQIRDMCYVCEGCQGSPSVEEWTSSRATRKCTCTRIKMKKSNDGHVERVQYGQGGRKVVQFLC
jgi:hypothetical protein